jgi:D-arabinonate dehydratase
VHITRIETTRLRLPFIEPPATGFLGLETRELLLVAVTTRAGVTGLGYLQPLAGGLRTLETCVHEMLAPLLMDEPVVDADGAPRAPELWDRLWSATYIQGRMGITVMALSALDVALWDAYGKLRDAPLYALWGGSDAPLEIYGSGCFRGLGAQGMIDKARRYRDDGFAAIKMQAGHVFTPDEDVANVAAMRAALGDDAAVMIDVNQAWNLPTALATGRRLDAFDPTWLEEPVAAHDADGYQRVALALRTPIAGGENHFTRHDLEPLLRSGRVRFLQPDVMRGGLTELRRIGERAAVTGQRLAPHLFHELMTHVVAAAPTGDWLEYMGWHDDLWVDPVTPEAGTVRPPPGPGHGLRLRPEVVARHAEAPAAVTRASRP